MHCQVCVIFPYGAFPCELYDLVLLLQLSIDGCVQVANSARPKGRARAGGRGRASAAGNGRAGGIHSESAGSPENNLSVSVEVGLGGDDNLDRGQGMRRGRATRAAAASQNDELQVCRPASIAVLPLWTPHDMYVAACLRQVKVLRQFCKHTQLRVFDSGK